MYFLINNKKKIVFGWSAKCGCTHIKRCFFRLTDEKHYKLPSQNKYSYGDETSIHGKYRKNLRLNQDQASYTKILFIRSPYKRLVSGFLDKYVVKSDAVIDVPELQLKIKDLTFEKFVDEIKKNKLKRVDKHHFSLQLSDAYNPAIIFDKIYDIENINYDYLKKTFKKDADLSRVIIRNEVSGEGDHVTIYDHNFEGKAYHYTIDQLSKINPKPCYRAFYNESIKQKVHQVYKEDFLFFEENGFNYDFLWNK